MTDLDNLRRMAKERAEFDPLAAMAMDGCASEIERLRWAKHSMKTALETILTTPDHDGEEAQVIRGFKTVAKMALRDGREEVRA